MPAHLNDVLAWIAETLSEDSVLQDDFEIKGVWRFGAPEGTGFPFLVYQKQTGFHRFTMGDKKLDTSFVMVKAVDTGHDGGERANLMADRAYELLHGQRPALANGGYTVRIEASNDFDFDEQESGNVNIYHSGVVFKVLLGH